MRAGMKAIAVAARQPPHLHLAAWLRCGTMNVVGVGPVRAAPRLLATAATTGTRSDTHCAPLTVRWAWDGSHWRVDGKNGGLVAVTAGLCAVATFMSASATEGAPGRDGAGAGGAAGDVLTLREDEDLAVLGRGVSVVLMSRGHSRHEAAAAAAAFRVAATTYGSSGEGGREAVRWYVVDDATPSVLATILTRRLGVEHRHPFVVVLDRFQETERKFLSTQAGVPTSADMLRLVHDAVSGRMKPARLGQPRPPRDRSPTCHHLWEVVTDSFEDVVLASHGMDVLMEGYTPKCDACKAFAPRYRMLAALLSRHWPTMRVARFDIFNNDRFTEHMPEKWTPSIRLFVDTPTAAAGGKQSCLLQLQDLQPGGGQAVDSTPAAGASPSQPRVVLPTLPELVSWIATTVAHHGGRHKYVITAAMERECQLLEEEAMVLEHAYDQTLQYMEVWKAYSDALHELQAHPPTSGSGVVRKPDPTLPAEQEALLSELRRRIVHAYRYLVEEAAGGGGAEEVVRRLADVASFIADHGVEDAIRRAFGDDGTVGH